MPTDPIDPDEKRVRMYLAVLGAVAAGRQTLAPAAAEKIAAEIIATRATSASRAARIAELEAEVARLRMVIERDRSIVAMTLTEIRKAIGGRQWLSEGGRGSYAYDDEDYQKEFGEALDEIAAAMQPLRRLAADWQNCPTDPLDITIARKGLRESFRAARLAMTGGDDRG